MHSNFYWEKAKNIHAFKFIFHTGLNYKILRKIYKNIGHPSITQDTTEGKWISKHSKEYYVNWTIISRYNSCSLSAHAEDC